MQVDVGSKALEINLEGEVKQYPYRTASARDRFMELRSDEGEFAGPLQDLHAKLAEVAGKRPDNHTVYEVTTPQGNKLYVMFHDHLVYFGLSVEVRPW